MVMRNLPSVLIGILISLNLALALTTEDYQSAGVRTVIRIYDECSKIESGFVPCLKKKAISFIDRLEQIDSINIGDGLKVIRLQNGAAASPPISRALSENDLESQLARGIEDRDKQLTTMLVERISRFFNGHTLQVNFPQITSDELGRSIEEGRGKMKKMMGMMMMGMAMKMMGMIPVAMAGLYMMAGKALIVSKIALLLAGIMGLKKLMSGKGGGGGGAGYSSGGGWSSGGGGSGWDRRSMDEEAQNLAYRAYSQQQEQNQQQQQQQQQQQPGQSEIIETLKQQ